MDVTERIRALRYRITDAYSRRRLAAMPGVVLGRNVKLRDIPLVQVDPGCQLVIGDDSLLNSRNYGYHMNMFAPVKLMLDGPNATITIGAQSRIHGTCVHARMSISIGDRCLIAANSQIIDSSGHDTLLETPELRISSRGSSAPVVIEDDVWIGAGCTVLPGVRIGRGSVVAAASVVTRDVPPQVVVAGSPAVIIREWNGS